ncbi:MAG: amino acid--tRNA ligase-related protein [bacterium]
MTLQTETGLPDNQLPTSVPPPLAGMDPAGHRAAAPSVLSILGQARTPLPLPQRIHIHNLVVHEIRRFLQVEGYVEIPVPELTPATGSCEVVDSMFSLDYFGGLAFPRQTGQLILEDVIAQGLDAVYCEGESMRRELKVDDRHLTEFKLIEIEKRDLDLDGLCQFQERLLKSVASLLHADDIGGDNVTRLDRMLHEEHPRLTYRQALVVLNRRGFSYSFGDDLDREAEASLNRYCGDLPLHVTHYPESLKFFNMKLDREDPEVVVCVDYILPFAGETFGGSVREPEYEILRRRLYGGTMFGHLLQRAREFAEQRHARLFKERIASAGSTRDQPGDRLLELEDLVADYQRGIHDSFENYLALFAEQQVERAGFGLGVARLLQYLTGTESIKDAVVFPMDRTRFGGLNQTGFVPQ